MSSLKKQGVKTPSTWSVAELSRFYVEHLSDLVSYASHLLHDRSRSEEVAQDALIKVILASPELESQEHALNYMYRTVESVCRDLYRYEGRRPKLVSLDDSISEVNALSVVQEDLVDSIAAANDAVIVRQALAMLSSAERAALVMWEFEGRSTEDIASQLGIKEKNVRHAVSRARASLHKVLSQFVIDKERGLTAVDLLSISYRKTVKIAKESGKTAMTFFLILFAFLGFNSMPSNVETSTLLNQESYQDSKDVQSKAIAESYIPKVEQDPISSPTSLSDDASREVAKKQKLRFPGLNKQGVPVSFTTADSSGGLGTAYFRERPVVTSESNLVSGQIIKTEEGAANVFILQTLEFSDSGLRYNPVVSFGRAGLWIPLEVRVTSTEIMRQSNGNYLLTAFINVESEIESPIKISATASGRDLAEAPRQVITRLVLDSSKTQVLAQAVYVVEQGVSA